MDLGSFWQKIREDKEIDLRMLSHETEGLNMSTISRVLSGKTPNPSLSTAVKINEALGGDSHDIYKILSGKKVPDEFQLYSTDTSDYLQLSEVEAFDRYFSNNPQEGAPILSNWLNNIYHSGKSIIDTRIDFNDEIRFEPSDIYKIVSRIEFVSYKLVYPRRISPQIIHKTFLQNGLMLRNDLITYTESRTDEENNKENIEAKLLFSATDALRKLNNSRFISSLYIRDLLDIDLAYSQDQGEIFLMGWRAAVLEIHWHDFQIYPIGHLLLLLERWIDHYDLDRHMWLSDIRSKI